MEAPRPPKSFAGSERVYWLVERTSQLGSLKVFQGWDYKRSLRSLKCTIMRL